MSLKDVLKKKCPNIVYTIGNKNKFWKSVDKKFKERYINIFEAVEIKNDITLSKAFVDNLVSPLSDSTETEYFLTDIDNRVKRIANAFNSSKTLMDKFRQILEQLILPVVNNAQAKDRIGEIYAIDYINMKPTLRIIDIEYRLDNGKEVDFLVENTLTGDKRLFDAFSIQVDSSKVEDEIKLKKYILDKICKKYTDKLKSKCNPEYAFQVLPILWTDSETLSKYNRVLSDFETRYNTELYGFFVEDNVSNTKFHFLPIKKGIKGANIT